MKWPRVKISPHHHSGKHLPHEHTSYALLAFLLLLTGVVLLGVTNQALAGIGDTSGSGSYNVYAAVTGPPPKLPAIIEQPASGQHVSSPVIQVSGRCESGYLVKVFDAGVLVGEVFCSATGRFNLQVQLFAGSNQLTANNFNAIDKGGPDSSPVVVYYDQPAVQTSNLAPPSVLQLKSDGNYRGFNVGDTASIKLQIFGGTAPYTLQVDWGEGQSEVITRDQPGSFEITHVYHRPGFGVKSSYPVILTAGDAAGQTAYLQLTVIINSPKTTLQTSEKTGGGKLLIAWPMFVLALFMLAFFKLGEIMRRQRLKPSGLSIGQII